jgi:YbbR domain-containing protein
MSDTAAEGSRARGWRRTVRFIGFLRDLVLRNVGLKLLSLLAAFALWVFVNAGARETERALQIPLELQNLPRHLMIVSPRVDLVDLRVSGPRTLLGRINPKELKIVLDLSGVRPGPAVFRVLTDPLNLPRGVKIARLTPSEVTLEFSRTSRRTLPVRVTFTGRPPGDLRVTQTKVAPESVEVSGPMEVVDKMQAVETAPIDLSTTEPGVIQRELLLEPPLQYLSYTASLVRAEVRLEEPEQTRVFKRVPVVVRNTSQRTTVKPESVSITVRGPRSALQALELDHGAVYIDAAGLEPGEHAIAPSADLPAEVELVKQEPAKLAVSVSSEKRKLP